ncbi:hypothetical protein ACHAWO_005236 [Cyclotella atomus]|uniref:SMODS and SLOG-associating 2TM effector domain-containing protein n=1 Tax=Cyclotella atomus TaxID=382360 RepID=A0ABD3P4P2_9STRA
MQPHLSASHKMMQKRPPSQDVHRSTSIDHGDHVEHIELCYVTKDSNSDESNHRMRISSLQELKSLIDLLDRKKLDDANPILLTDSEEATIGQHQGDKKKTNSSQHAKLPTEYRVRTYSSDAEFGPHFSDRMNTTQQAFLDEVKRFELFRSVIQHEDDLLNQRVSWIILAQSFLMAAFMTNTSDDGNGNSLRYITAAVGLLTVVVTLPAILAAGRNIELQQHVYFARISSEQRCKELHGHGRIIGHDRTNNVDMKAEHKERINAGHIFPNMAFRGRGALSILNTVIALATVQVIGWCFLLIALVKGW